MDPVPRELGDLTAKYRNVSLKEIQLGRPAGR